MRLTAIRLTVFIFALNAHLIKSINPLFSMVYRYLLIVIETDVQSVIKVVFVKPKGIVTIKADIHVPLGRNTDFALLVHDVDESL